MSDKRDPLSVKCETKTATDETKPAKCVHYCPDCQTGNCLVIRKLTAEKEYLLGVNELQREIITELKDASDGVAGE